MSVNAWFIALPAERQAFLRENKWLLAEAAYEEGLAQGKALMTPLVNQPAQTGDVPFDDNAPSPPPTLGDYIALQQQYDALQTQLKKAKDQLTHRDPQSKGKRLSVP